MNLIPAGEVHALLGRNGSGKTSLLMAGMGFTGYEITSGRILFEGQDITHADITTRARLGIGIAPQRPPTIPGVRLQSIINYAYGGGQGLSSAYADIVAMARRGRFSIVRSTADYQAARFGAQGCCNCWPCVRA